MNDTIKTGINDLQFEKSQKEVLQKQEAERQAAEKEAKKEQRKAYIKEYKENTIPVLKVKKSLLITAILCGLLGLFALYNGYWGEAVLTLLSGVFTIVFGQNMRMGSHQPKLTNVLLWNLSKSIRDFIDYKIPYEIFENKDKWLDMYAVLGMIVFAICPSSNVFYGIVLVLILLSFIVAFAVEDIKGIHQHCNIIVIGAITGLIIKALYGYIMMAVIDVDLFNVVLINLFIFIEARTQDLEIQEPKE